MDYGVSAEVVNEESDEPSPHEDIASESTNKTTDDRNDAYVYEEAFPKDDGGRYGFLDGLDDEDDDPQPEEKSDADDPSNLQTTAETEPPVNRIRDLEPDIDGYNRPIYVESRQEHDGKPLIWYHQDKHGNYIRHQRGTFGIKLDNLGTSGRVPYPVVMTQMNFDCDYSRR